MVNMKRNLVLIIFFILTLSVMALIFFFSSQNASLSSRTSSSFVRLILSLLVRNFSSLSSSEQNALIVKYASFIRKCAHFTEFGALGFCFTTSLSLRSAAYIYPRSLLFGVVYAALDEIHQLFSDGRACSLRDVLIDTSGFACGLILSVLITSLIRKRKG